MIVLAAAMALALLPVPVLPTRSIPPHPCRLEEAAYSRGAYSLSDVYEGCGTLSIPSPDRRSRVTVGFDRDERMYIEVAGAIGRLKRHIVAGPNHELSWAPDSRAFFLTVNDGGIVGSYYLYVVARVHGRLGMIDLNPLIDRGFGRPVRCFDEEGPNIAAIGWRGSSRRLIAAAEIVPHSNCDSMGNFRAFEVDPIRRRIFASYGQLDAKRRFWRLLGDELRNADDDCARSPRACFIPQLHPETVRRGKAPRR